MFRRFLHALRAIFTQRSVILLYLPILAEQAMSTFVGFISTIMVGHAGSVAISAVGVVKALNNVIVFTLFSIASGVAAVAAQFLGAKQKERAERCIGQFCAAVLMVSVAIAALLVLFSKPILSFLFGAAEPEVLDAARIYLIAGALSMPFAAISSLLSATMRGCGNTRMPMASALLINIVNTLLCWITIYGLEMGVTGASISLVAARAAGAAFMLVLMFRPGFPLHLRKFFPIVWKDILPILRIGVPMGLDTAMFNGGKLIVQVFMTGMGTYTIAANAVTQSVVSLIEIPGNAMCTLAITLVGFSVGAGEFREARRHGWYTTLAASILQLIVCIPLWFTTPWFVGLFSTDPDVIRLSIVVTRSMVLTSPFLWSTAFTLASVLRSAGDVRYTVTSSLIIMWVIRVLLSWVFGVVMDGGLLGIWIAMYVDWAARTALFVPRFKSKRWENRAVT